MFVKSGRQAGKARMDKQIYTIGDRVEKICLTCGESRGHIVALINKNGRISRVNCPQCGTRSTFKKGSKTESKLSSGDNLAPYDWTRTYRKGQGMLHHSFGRGEVVAVIEPCKIDVLFSDKVRRLVHSQAQAALTTRPGI